jgi:hypothetical protein
VRSGLTGQLGKYAEALELIWFQYVVGYDKQEQRSLATSLQTRIFNYRRSLTSLLAAVKKAISLYGPAIALIVLTVGAVLLLLVVARRVRRFGWRRGLSWSPPQTNKEASAVAFYERLIALLALRGVQRDPSLTPLEFAGSLDFQPVLFITRAYNRVRYGGQKLSSGELADVERALSSLEATTVAQQSMKTKEGEQF